MRHQKTFSRKDGSTVTVVSLMLCAPCSRNVEFDNFAILERAGSPKAYFYPRKGLLTVARPGELLETNHEALQLAGGVA